MSGSRFDLWVEALSAVRAAAGQPSRPAQYRVRGLPAEFDIRIAEDPETGKWRIRRGGEPAEGGFDSASAALQSLQAEFDSRYPDV